jgi:hypothetical protein
LACPGRDAERMGFDGMVEEIITTLSRLAFMENGPSWRR